MHVVAHDRTSNNRPVANGRGFFKLFQNKPGLIEGQKDRSVDEQTLRKSLKLRPAGIVGRMDFIVFLFCYIAFKFIGYKTARITRKPLTVAGPGQKPDATELVKR